MDPVTGAIIGDAIVGASSVGQGLFGYLSTKETNKSNRELAELAYQQNLEQWNRENAYNHPAQQMVRLREAGLNPNLVYGSGSAVQTSAKSPQLAYPEMKTPHLEFNLPNVFNSILDMKMKAMQIEEIQSVRDRNNAEKGLLAARAITEGYIGKLRKFDSEVQADLFNATMDEILQGITNQETQNELMGYQIGDYKERARIAKQEADLKERFNKFLEDNPSLAWVYELGNTLENYMPGVWVMLSNFFGLGRGRTNKGKHVKQKKGPDGNVLWEVVDYNE